MCAHIIRVMPNITLAVAPELHRKLRKHPEVKWSEVVRRVLAKRVRDLERMEALARGSILTSGDVGEIDHLIKEGLRRRYEKMRRTRGA